MEKDDRKNGAAAQVAGGRGAQVASRPAPGKVTRTSQALQRRGGAVQRKPIAGTPGGAHAPSRSLWDRTMDSAMDAAHRGVTAESSPAPVPGPDAGQAVQRQSVVQKADEAPAAEAPATAELPPLAEADVVLSREPGDTAEEYVGWFRDLVRDALAPWGMPFDPAAVRAVAESGESGPVPVLALRWNDAWGARPSTPSTSWVYSRMEPVEATAAVTAVQTLAGWNGLSAADRSMLQNLLGGESNLLSQTARDHLAAQFATLQTQPAAQQATALAALISTEDAMPRLADEPVSGELVPYDLEGPTDQPAYAFRGITADAEVWTARYIDNVLFPIVAPKAPQAGYHFHTVEQVAEAAARVPTDTRSVITRVLLNPVENPQNDYWAAEYEEADFTAYMSAGARGVVAIFPSTDSAPDEGAMPGSITHETGHAWSLRTWGKDTTQGKWIEWQAAMDSDKAAVSGYAHEAIVEDVAETIRVYVSTRGTPAFDEYRSIVPHRFAMLDREYRP